VDADIFMTGEVNLLASPRTDAKAREELITRVSSTAFHILLIASILVWPRIFPPRAPSQEQMDLARRQITILLPPGALDAPKTTPKPKEPPVRVDPRVLRRVAPPTPQPTAPAPKEPERIAKELPSAPVPKPNTAPPAPQQNDTVAKAEAPRSPLKLEAPQEQTNPNALLLPKNSMSRSLQDSIR